MTGHDRPHEWVVDATPLIYLATVDRLDLLTALDGEPLTSRRVYGEVVADGLAAGHADARRVERLVETDRLAVVEADETDGFARLRNVPTLSAADASVLALAAGRDATVIMDERAGRSVAHVEQIDCHGTAYVLLRAVADGRLSEAAATGTLDALLDAGWYCAPDLYARLVDRFAELA